MSENHQQEEVMGTCCSAIMVPIGFFIAAVIAVAISVVTGILDVDLFTATLYVFGLQVLFLLLFTIVYALRSNE